MVAEDGVDDIAFEHSGVQLYGAHRILIGLTSVGPEIVSISKQGKFRQKLSPAV